jgi:hypothetical protein
MELVMQNTLTAFRFTLAYAEKLVADLEDDHLAVLPHAGMNHPAWILGHVALGSDFVALLLGKELLTDDGWMKTFGPGSVPVEDRSAYPTKAELVDTMRKTHARAIELLEAATVEELAAPNQTPFFPQQFPTVGDLATHLVTTHAAMHLGQLSAWRRCVGKDSVLGI